VVPRDRAWVCSGPSLENLAVKIKRGCHHLGSTTLCGVGVKANKSVDLCYKISLSGSSMNINFHVALSFLLEYVVQLLCRKANLDLEVLAALSNPISHE
jgi:hypothetical protein